MHFSNLNANDLKDYALAVDQISSLRETEEKVMPE